MSQEILAPLTGKIVIINVEPGQSVEEDEDILTIEAMKMEIPIFAPCDGKIRAIKVKVGDSVEEDDIVAVIE